MSLSIDLLHVYDLGKLDGVVTYLNGVMFPNLWVSKIVAFKNGSLDLSCIEGTLDLPTTSSNSAWICG